MFDVFLEVYNRRVDLDFVLPIILSPLLFELKLGAIGWHQSVNEVDLNFVDVDDVRDVAARRVEAKVAVDSAIVGRADLQGALDDLRLVCLKRERNGLLDHFEVSLG